jgi:hypothetical protein
MSIPESSEHVRVTTTERLESLPAGTRYVPDDGRLPVHVRLRSRAWSSRSGELDLSTRDVSMPGMAAVPAGAGTPTSQLHAEMLEAAADLESLPRWARPVIFADAPPAVAYDELVTLAAAAITALIGPLERADPDVRHWPADEQELQRRMDWPDFTSRNEAVAGLLVVKAARAALAAAGIHAPSGQG